MDLGPLRALVLDLNIDAHGVPATITPVEGSGIEPFPTRVIWLTNQTEDVPSSGLQRREPRRVMALKRDEAQALPIGTVIQAPEKSGGPAYLWRVDSFDEHYADQQRLIVVRVG